MDGDPTYLFYRLDPGNVIVGVGGAWDRFARDNGGGHLVSSRIIGQHLDAHVSGERTRLFVRTLLDASRRLGRTGVFSYRCDAPNVRRTLEMRIEPEADGFLAVGHRIVASSVRLSPIYVRELPRGLARGRVVQRCSFCNQVSGAGGWQEPENLLAAASSESNPQAVVHVVCSECYAAVSRRRSGAQLHRAHEAIAETRRRARTRAIGQPRKNES